MYGFYNKYKIKSSVYIKRKPRQSVPTEFPTTQWTRLELAAVRPPFYDRWLPDPFGDSISCADAPVGYRQHDGDPNGGQKQSWKVFHKGVLLHYIIA